MTQKKLVITDEAIAEVRAWSGVPFQYEIDEQVALVDKLAGRALSSLCVLKIAVKMNSNGEILKPLVEEYKADVKAYNTAYAKLEQLWQSR